MCGNLKLGNQYCHFYERLNKLICICRSITIHTMLLPIYPFSPLAQQSLCYLKMFLRGLRGHTLKMDEGKFHPRTGHKGREGE